MMIEISTQSTTHFNQVRTDLLVITICSEEIKAIHVDNHIYRLLLDVVSNDLESLHTTNLFLSLSLFVSKALKPTAQFSREQ